MIIQHYSIALLATAFALLLSGCIDNNAFAIDVTTNDAELQPHHGYMRGGCRGVEKEDKTIPSANIPLVFDAVGECNGTSSSNGEVPGGGIPSIEDDDDHFVIKKADSITFSNHPDGDVASEGRPFSSGDAADMTFVPDKMYDDEQMMEIDDEDQLLASTSEKIMMVDYLHGSRSLATSKWEEVYKKEGANDGDNFGNPSCLSGDGKTLAVAAVNTDQGGTDSGTVHVYKRNGSGGFDQNVGNVPGTEQWGLLGWSLSLSDNGSILAVGAPGENGNRGRARLYTDQGTGYAPFSGGSLLDSSSAVGNRFGHSVSLSGDGNSVAVGAPYRPVTFHPITGLPISGGGYVNVYNQVNPATGNASPPIVVTPLTPIQGFGYSVSLSDNGGFLGVGNQISGKVEIYERTAAGYVVLPHKSCTIAGDSVTFAGKSNIFAVRQPGEVKVYKINVGVCEPYHIGATIPISPAPFGSNTRNEILFSLSDNGKRLAIADKPNFSGQVFVYELEKAPANVGNGMEYHQKGEPMSIPNSQSVSLSNDGNLLAFGTGFQQGTPSADNGFTHVYEWKTSSPPSPTPPTPTPPSPTPPTPTPPSPTPPTPTPPSPGCKWIEVDKEDGSNDNDSFGKPSFLSGDGMILAVGAINSDPNDQDSGSVHIYKRSGSGDFQQLAGNIPGTEKGGKLGWSITLSDNGSVMAVGAPGEGGGKGRVHFYQNSGAAYSLLLTLPVPDATLNDRFGHSVSLSGDGTWLAVGAPSQPVTSIGVNPVGGGYVHVYQTNSISGSAPLFADLHPPTPTEGFGYSVSLSDDGGYLGVGNQKKGEVLIYVRSTSTYDQGCTIPGGQAVSFGGKSNKFAVLFSGYVSVYQINGGACSLYHVGSVPIQATSTGTDTRNEILFSLSDDGNVLAIADTPGFYGRVFVYERVPAPTTLGLGQYQYVKKGEYIDISGSESVSLSDDGNLVAFGTGFQPGSASADNGSAYVYECKMQTPPPVTPPPTPTNPPVTSPPTATNAPTPPSTFPPTTPPPTIVQTSPPQTQSSTPAPTNPVPTNPLTSPPTVPTTSPPTAPPTMPPPPSLISPQDIKSTERPTDPPYTSGSQPAGSNTENNINIDVNNGSDANSKNNNKNNNKAKNDSDAKNKNNSKNDNKAKNKNKNVNKKNKKEEKMKKIQKIKQMMKDKRHDNDDNDKRKDKKRRNNNDNRKDNKRRDDNNNRKENKRRDDKNDNRRDDNDKQREDNDKRRDDNDKRRDDNEKRRDDKKRNDNDTKDRRKKDTRDEDNRKRKDDRDNDDEDNDKKKKKREKHIREKRNEHDDLFHRLLHIIGTV